MGNEQLQIPIEVQEASRAELWPVADVERTMTLRTYPYEGTDPLTGQELQIRMEDLQSIAWGEERVGLFSIGETFSAIL